MSDSSNPTVKTNRTPGGRLIPNYKEGGTNYRSQLGGAFQAKVTDPNLEYLMLRDGAARRIVVGPPKDALKRPPKIMSDDEPFQIAANALILAIKYHNALQVAYTSARGFGYGLVLLGFETVGGLETPVENPRGLVNVSGLWKTQVKGNPKICDDPLNLEYYGKIISYTIMVQINGTTVEQVIHASRVQHITSEIHANDPTGVPSLLPLFNTFQGKLNMDYSLAHAIYRYAQPFTTLELPLDADNEEFLDVSQAFYLDDRNEFVMPNGYKVDQYGASGALNPQPYVDYSWQNICAGSEFNKTALIGDEAGAITGSWTNQAEYFANIASIQTTVLAPQGYQDLIIRCQKHGLLGLADFDIDWPELWELDQKEMAQRKSELARATFTEAMALEKYWLMARDGMPIEVGFDDSGWYVLPKGKPEAKHYMFSENKLSVKANSTRVRVSNSYRSRDESDKLQKYWLLHTSNIEQEWQAILSLGYLDISKALTAQVQKILESEFPEILADPLALPLSGSQGLGYNSERQPIRDRLRGLLKLKSRTRNIKLNDQASALEAIRKLLSIPIKMSMANAYADLMAAAHKLGYFNTVQTTLVEGGQIDDTFPYLLEDRQAQDFLTRSELLWEEKNNEILSAAKWGIMEGIAQGEGITRIQERIQDELARVARPAVFVNTEVHRASELGRTSAYKDLEVTEVEWLTAGDDKVRPEHEARDGKIFPIKEAEAMISEPNCRCTLIPILPDSRRGSL